MSTKIGSASNYYGGLRVIERDGRCYWFIEDWSSDVMDPDSSELEEIPRTLYDELVAFEKQRDQQ